MTITPAGWYDDPVRPERLRYWDGHAWTEWISDDGATSSEPIGDAAGAAGGPAAGEPAAAAAGEPGPATPVVAPTRPGPAPGAVPARLPGPVPVRRYPATRLARAAHVAVAAAGVAALATSGRTISVQFNEGALGAERVTYQSSASLTFMALLLVGAGLLPVFLGNVWVRMTCLATGAAAAGFLSLALIGTTSDDDLLYLDVRGAWWVLFAAAALALAATLAAALTATRAGDGPDGLRPAAPFAWIGLGAALIGVVVMPVSALGAAFGVLGLRDAASATPRRDRRLALAVVVLGALVFAAWSLGLLAGAVTGTGSAPLGAPPDASGTAALLFSVA